MIERLFDRGVFATFGSVETSRRGRQVFEVTWHKGRVLQIAFDRASRTLTVPNLLPALDRKSPLYKALRAFVASFSDCDRPEHRRAPPEKVLVILSLRDGFARLSVRTLDGDLEYALSKLVQIVNEVFMLFLGSGEYFAYRVEHLGADADWGT